MVDAAMIVLNVENQRISGGVYLVADVWFKAEPSEGWSPAARNLWRGTGFLETISQKSVLLATIKTQQHNGDFVDIR